MKIIIAGGGTGGHVFPAIAIANAIKEEEPTADILFVGAKGKIEMEKVPKAGYPIEGLWISGFHRKLTWRNLVFPFKLLFSLIKAMQIIGRFQPDVVVGVGGYASGPIVEIATRKGIPTLIQEQNSFPGITNRLLAKKVTRICAAYREVEQYFPKEKITLTGNPVRKDILDWTVTKEEALRHFGLDVDKKTIFIFGGSLGAQSINEAVAANVELLSQNPQVQVLWQAGKLYIDRFKLSAAVQLPNVHIRQFIDRMDMAYQLADVIIARAGALTISELCWVGKSAILIPSPNVAEDHQTKNAMALVDKEAAIIIKDQDAKAKIIEVALEVIEQVELQKKLSNNIKKLAKPKASEMIAKEILKLV